MAKPSPSWPYRLLPALHTVPSPSSAIDHWKPTATATVVDGGRPEAGTGVGVMDGVCVLFSSSPKPLNPHPTTAPLERTAKYVKPPRYPDAPMTLDRPGTWVGVGVLAEEPVPRPPSKPRRKVHAVPSPLTTSELLRAAAAPMAPDRPGTGAGVGIQKQPDVEAMPLPSSPSAFLPQVKTDPSERTATVWSEPSANAVTPLTPTACCGLATQQLFLAVEPVPSCPSVLSPHSQTVPSALRAPRSPPPTDMAVTAERPGTWVGVGTDGVNVPIPTSPSWL